MSYDSYAQEVDARMEANLQRRLAEEEAEWQRIRAQAHANARG